MNIRLQLLNSKVIDQLVKDVGVETTLVFLSSVKDELNTRMENIIEAKKEKSFEKLSAEAHALKSCSSAGGAIALSQMLLQIETLAKDKDPEALALVEKAHEVIQLTQMAYQELNLEE